MEPNRFLAVATRKGEKKWEAAIKRETLLYERPNDIRSDFARDYNRILHCTAYRRLKHKTQVFFATKNDHICTRIEHVNHVTAVSNTIAKFLGLNTELTNAIALGHDLGHAPFGHAGESVIKGLIIKIFGDGGEFWHEKNSLRFVDKIETLEGPDGQHKNLNLTYAVRDGIICHCGEIHDKILKPRGEAIDLSEIKKANSVNPFTWEGCVVKVSDKISYYGRDIEDAISLEILSDKELKELNCIIKKYDIEADIKANNTIIMHSLITNLCIHSSPENGISMSSEFYKLMQEIHDFNYNKIYLHPRVQRYKAYVDLIINTIFTVLSEKKCQTSEESAEYLGNYPKLSKDFGLYLNKYAALEESSCYSQIYKPYNLTDEADYKMACIDYIAGMTDTYAIKIFDEIITF